MPQTKLELVLSAIVAFYALASLLAHALPAGSKPQVFCARVALYLGKIQTMLPKAPAADETKP